MTRRAALRLAGALALGGCHVPAAAPTVLTFPSELGPEAVLGFARNVLRRAGWSVAPPTDATMGQAFTTGWHKGSGSEIRLLIDAADVGGGASSVVRIRGEALRDGRAVPIVQASGRRAASPEWTAFEAAARFVGARVRYALV